MDLLWTRRKLRFREVEHFPQTLAGKGQITAAPGPLTQSKASPAQGVLALPLERLEISKVTSGCTSLAPPARHIWGGTYRLISWHLLPLPQVPVSGPVAGRGLQEHFGSGHSIVTPFSPHPNYLLLGDFIFIGTRKFFQN